MSEKLSGRFPPQMRAIAFVQAGLLTFLGASRGHSSADSRVCGAGLRLFAETNALCHC
jgi:hypothetical protein